PRNPATPIDAVPASEEGARARLRSPGSEDSSCFWTSETPDCMRTPSRPAGPPTAHRTFRSADWHRWQSEMCKSSPGLQEPPNATSQNRLVMGQLTSRAVPARRCGSASAAVIFGACPLIAPSPDQDLPLQFFPGAVQAAVECSDGKPHCFGDLEL